MPHVDLDSPNCFGPPQPTSMPAVVRPSNSVELTKAEGHLEYHKKIMSEELKELIEAKAKLLHKIFHLEESVEERKKFNGLFQELKDMEIELDKLTETVHKLRAQTITR